MDTHKSTISNFLNQNNTSFFIPPFQRSYSWGRAEIERYFDDVKRIINSEIDPKQVDKLEHFFGTIVIQVKNERNATKSIVIDGQQRLTTTLLFLIALRDLETNEENKNAITEDFLKNNRSSFPDKIKLKQVTKDWDAYSALVNNKKKHPGKITDAYSLFQKLLIENKKINPHIQFENYQAALHKMNIAVIFLDERPHKGEDPQIIFETLNSLGKPLTLSDLVRNYVLLRKQSDEQSDIYENVWHPKIENVFYNPDPKKDITSNFFREYLRYKTKSTTIKVASSTNTKELYQKFKDFVEDKNNFNSHSDFIDDIIRYVDWYKWIITETVTDTISSDTNNDKIIKELVRNIFHDIAATAFIPLVLGLFECHQDGINGTKLSDDLLINSLKDIRIYLIRRRILKLTQGENKNIVSLCEHIERIAEGKISMIDLLCNMFYAIRTPNDDEIKTRLITSKFYEESKTLAKFILGKIEENNAKVAVDFRKKEITIEHIMPQKLNSSWETELGSDFANTHKTYLHNIGNLILTEFNGEMSNKPFSEKKERLKDSNLYFRKYVLDRNSWNEQSILEHQGKMINWFLETFPLPDEYKTASNWDTNIKVSDEPEELNLSDFYDYDFTFKKIQTAEFLGNKLSPQEYSEKKWTYFPAANLYYTIAKKLFEETPEIYNWDEVRKILEIRTEFQKGYDKISENIFIRISPLSADNAMKKLLKLCDCIGLKEDDLVIIVAGRNNIVANEEDLEDND